MKTIRPAALAAVVVTLLLALSGCFGTPSVVSGGGTTTDTSLAGTSWAGTDSDGDTWELEFQADNSLAFTYNGESYDDASDTWALAGGTLTTTIVFSDGTATMTGPYAAGATSIDLNGSQGDATWTLPITKQ